MQKITLSEIKKVVNERDIEKLKPISITILRNIMVESMEAYLQYFIMQVGYDATVKFGEYDNIYQESISSPELLSEQTDCVILFMYLPTLSEKIWYSFHSQDKIGIDEEKKRIEEHVTDVVTGIRNQTSATILFCGFESPTIPSFGLYDYQIEDGQTGTVKDLNQRIKKILCSHSNAFFLDMDASLRRVGAEQFYDMRYWHIARSPYTLEACVDISNEVAKCIRCSNGDNKKCLALDCDNTIWGGIVGEDDINGIKLGLDFPGSCYLDLQKELLELYRRGVILAICSKNNEQDVWRVFDEHPHMILKKEHISAYEINWDDKATNIQKIAKSLNIGTDSIVLLDDSDFEVNLIRQEMPEVSVLHISKQQAVNAKSLLAGCGLFDTLTISTEDRNRGEMYASENKRKHLMMSVPDLESYYASLQMETSIYLVDDFSISRVAQQTQKTNQFNLTTERYNENEIKSFASNSEFDVICLALRDRFGESGIVGSAIIKYEEEFAVVDLLLLSCRVLGRGVENVFLYSLIERARKQGMKTIIGKYCPSQKNSQVAEFYPGNGFHKDHVAQDGTCFYTFDLNSNIIEKPKDYYSIDCDWLD